VQIIDEIVADFLAHSSVPGVSIATFENGEVETKSYGIADTSTQDRPYRVFSLFPVESRHRLHGNPDVDA